MDVVTSITVHGTKLSEEVIADLNVINDAIVSEMPELNVNGEPVGVEMCYEQSRIAGQIAALLAQNRDAV